MSLCLRLMLSFRGKGCALLHIPSRKMLLIKKFVLIKKSSDQFDINNSRNPRSSYSRE